MWLPSSPPLASVPPQRWGARRDLSTGMGMGSGTPKCPAVPSPICSPPALKDWPVASLQVWFWGSHRGEGLCTPRPDLVGSCVLGFGIPALGLPPWGDGSGALGLGFLGVLDPGFELPQGVLGSFRVPVPGLFGVLALGSLGFQLLAPGSGSCLWGLSSVSWLRRLSGSCLQGHGSGVSLGSASGIPCCPSSGVSLAPGLGVPALASGSGILWGAHSGLSGSCFWGHLWSQIWVLALSPASRAPQRPGSGLLGLGSLGMAARGWFWLWGPSGVTFQPPQSTPRAVTRPPMP